MPTPTNTPRLGLLLAGLLAPARGQAADLPQVDPAVHTVSTCRLSMVSFRTEQEGWVADMCGHLFHSVDGGRGWQRDKLFEAALAGPSSPPPGDEVSPGLLPGSNQLGFIRWLSPTEAVAGGYIGARILRTQDAGRTWSQVALPSAQWVYAVFARGDALWLCGSSGEIDRSTDRGHNWQRLASPFNDVERCMELSFDNQGRGRALGMFGSRWQSSDDGATWTHEAGSPDVAPLEGESPSGQTTMRVFPDGGFGMAPLPDRPSVHTRQLGEESAWGKGTVRLANSGILTFEEPGHIARRQPLLSPASGKVVPLLGVGRLGQAAYGYTEESLYFAEDGATWYVRAPLPARPAKLTFVSERAAVLETAGGVFRSEDGGRTWKQSVQPTLDRSDAERVGQEGEASQSPGPNPLACLATSDRAELHVDFDTQGCFGGSRNNIQMRVRGGRATLEGELGGRTKKQPLESTGLSEAERQQLVQQFGEAVARLEVPSQCESTTEFSAKLRWSCDGRPGQTLEFSTHDCGGGLPEHVGGSTQSRTGKATGYARAHGIHTVARAALARHGVE